MQVYNFTAKGISSAFAHHSNSAIMADIVQGKFQLVFISPESLICNLQWREMLRSQIYQESLVGVAIDEAHCATKW